MATTLMQRRAPSTLMRSSIGKKVMMAVTGIILFLFVLFHMLGNLKIFTGREHFDTYAEFLKDIGRPILGHLWYLWAQRTVLLIAVFLHMWGAWTTYRQSANARPVRYQHPDAVQSAIPPRTMRWGGIAIALFVAFHLLNLTTGTVHTHFVAGAAYENVLRDFKLWYIDVIYFVALFALGMHLYHGLWSSLQTLGRNRPERDETYRRVSKTVATVTILGYVAVPLAVIVGLVS